LAMRMDPSQELSARDLLNTWDRRRLARTLREYGEERFADRIAGEIIRRRPLTTTFQLVDAITAAIPAPARFAGGHPAKRTFQAIRIAVNDELAQLDAALPLAWDVLRVGGLLRGRAWIWLIGVLLGGIVAMQVSLLKLNAGISNAVTTSSTLQRQNADIEAEIAKLSSIERVRDAAVADGMVTPAPGAITYLHARPGRDDTLATHRMAPPSDSAA